MRPLAGHTYRLPYNSRGYRGREVPVERDPARPRVVFLGDSFVDGSEVGDEEVFSSRLEQANACLDAVNLGVYSYSTAQELLTLQHVGLRYEPDLVVLVTISNDFPGNLRNFSEFGTAPRFLPVGDSLVFEGTRHSNARQAARAISLPVPGMLFLQQHSHLYWLLNSRIYQRLRARRIWALSRRAESLLDESGRRALYLQLVRRMRDAVTRNGGQFLVVFGPLKEELADSLSPHAALVDSLGASGIQSVDLHGPIREAMARGEPLYYAEDIHWNNAGHEVLAALLTPHLRRVLGPRHPGSCLAP
jgi:lysophospholipase L1-like esterase